MTPRLARTFVPLILAMAIGSWACADEAPSNALARKDLDARLNVSLRDVINVGASIYNNCDEYGCARLYEGTLMTTVVLLDHRPALKKSVEEMLARADKMTDAADRAHLYRKALDEIRAAIKKDLGPTTAPPPRVVTPAPKPAAKAKSLWDRMGGETGMRLFVRETMRQAEAEPKVNFTRGGKFKPTDADLRALEQKLVEYFSYLTGGPLVYTGKSAKDAHKGMGVTKDEYRALTDIAVKVLRAQKLPEPDVAEMIYILQTLARDVIEDQPAKSLWERLGGEAAIKTVIHDFVVTASTDPKVNVTRDNKFKIDVPKLEQSVLEFISSVTDGPLKYTGRSMKDAHAGMKISEAEFKAHTEHLVAALKKNKVAQKEIDELITILGKSQKDIVEK